MPRMDDGRVCAAPVPGDMAPEFRLPVAQGGEMGPADFRGRANLVLWFSKGLTCPFCRRNMAQLGQRYPEFRARGAEILQVTHNTFDEGRRYLGHYPIVFPYLCDPDRSAHERYGLAMIPAALSTIVRSGIAYTTDLMLRGQTTPSPVPYFKRYPGKDSPQAVFIVDRTGVIRFAYGLQSTETLPVPPELLRALATLDAAAA